MTWTDYFERTKNHPPRELLIKAVFYVTEKNDALDLGAGALNESRYLLASGFKHVTAIDKEPVASEIAKTFPADFFSYVIADAETYMFPTKKFDIVNAHYSIPFIHPDLFGKVMQNIYQSLKLSGIFVGQFFGQNDEWNIENSGMTFLTKDEAISTLSDFEILVFDEEETDKPTAAGRIKHWHIFNFIARKR